MSSLMENYDAKVKLIDGVQTPDEKQAEVAASNQTILWITTISFLLFVIAEIIGAYASNSLALLGDAAAMSVDVVTYACSIWVERIKARGEKLSKCTRMTTEVYIPAISVAALLAVSGWVTSDAIDIIMSKSEDEADDVDVKFLYGFAVANFLVDLISSYAFYRKKDDTFFDPEAAKSRESARSDGYSIDSEQKAEAKSGFHINLNMASAFTHVGGDTLRTAAIFFAAVVTTATTIPGRICDAWADVIVTITIVFLVIPLVKEIIAAAYAEHDDE